VEGDRGPDAAGLVSGRDVAGLGGPVPDHRQLRQGQRDGQRGAEQDQRGRQATERAYEASDGILEINRHRLRQAEDHASGPLQTIQGNNNAG